MGQQRRQVMSDRVCYDDADTSTAIAPSLAGPLSRLVDGYWDYGLSTDFDPRYEIRESDDAIKIIFELPGVKKDDVHVEIGDGILKLSGERKAPEMAKGENCCCSGLSYGAFEREFQLPDTAKEDSVRAHFHDGLLELTIDKREEKKRKAITIKVD
jgi:HSP20 family protein